MIKKLMAGVSVFALLLGFQPLAEADCGQDHSGSSVKGSATKTSAASAAIGKPAPNFTLIDNNGESHTLSNYNGKFVILEWVSHDCPFVKKHYSSGNMQKLQKDYAARDEVVWLSVCSSAPGKSGYYESPEARQLTVEKGAAPTAVLRDEDGTVGRLYGAKTTPHMFIIDAAGTLVYAGAIDDTPSTDPKDVNGAKNYVASSMDALLAGDSVPRASTKPYGCGVKYAK